MKKCDSCGFPADGLICNYCGSFLGNSHDVQTERKALQAYHRLLLETIDRKKLVSLLENGFLPEQRQTLIEAGLRCMPLVQRSSANEVLAATRRLEASIIKLKLMPDDDAIEQVLPRFEAAVAEVKAYNEKFDRVLWLIVLGSGAACCGGIIFFVGRMLTG